MGPSAPEWTARDWRQGDRTGSRGSSFSGSERACILTAISGRKGPRLRFSSNVKDKPWLTVALTLHSEPVVGDGSPTLPTVRCHAFAAPLTGKSISNTENKSCIIGEAAAPCLPEEDTVQALAGWAAAAAARGCFSAEGPLFAGRAAPRSSPSPVLAGPRSPLSFLSQDSFPGGWPWSSFQVSLEIQGEAWHGERGWGCGEPQVFQDNLPSSSCSGSGLEKG